MGYKGKKEKVRVVGFVEAIDLQNWFLDPVLYFIHEPEFFKLTEPAMFARSVPVMVRYRLAFTFAFFFYICVRYNLQVILSTDYEFI